MFTWFLALSLAVSSSAAAPEQETCPDPERELQSAQQDAVSFYLQDAQKGILTAIEGFGCTGPAHTALVAVFWQTQGFIWGMQENGDKASTAYAAAKRIEPTLWNEDFGDTEKARFDAAESISGDRSVITFRGLGNDDWITVDGIQTKGVVRLEPGMHLIQVGSGDLARFAAVLDVVPGQASDVAVPGGNTAGIESKTLATTESKKTSPVKLTLLGTGIASLVTAGAMFAVAGSNAGDFRDASGPLDVVGTERSRANAQQFTLLGIGAGGAAVALATTALVVRF